MRTYMLVCLGSTVVMLTGQRFFEMYQSGDPSRLGAQVVSGIGFLGAGTIISSGEMRVKGLTTAAGLWATACIGLAIGTQYYSVAIVSTLAIYIIMTLFKRFEDRVVGIDKKWRLYMESNHLDSIMNSCKRFEEMGLEVLDIRTEKADDVTSAIIEIRKNSSYSNEMLLKNAKSFQDIRNVRFLNTY